MKMANAILLIVSTLFVLSLPNSINAQAPPPFVVEGRVYCDTCRVKFETTLSEGIEGADVLLDCRNANTKAKTCSAEGKTDKDGWYEISLESSAPEKEKDICEVMVEDHQRVDCKEPIGGKAIIDWSDKSKKKNNSWFVDSIGYMIEKPLEYCKDAKLEPKDKVESKDAKDTLDDYLNGMKGSKPAGEF